MAGITLHTVLDHLRRLHTRADAAQRSDRELLHAFATEHDQDAFAVVVRRHAALVWGVCRRILGHQQDAEDAFQATFVILARRAGSVRWRPSVGGWLHTVAQRLAVRVRRQAEQRRAHEQQARRTPVDSSLRELAAVVDEELQRLPVKYREPLLLHYWEGMTAETAARQLGLSRALFYKRLNRGREMLRERLQRQGLSLAAPLLAAALAPEVEAASGALIQATLRGVMGNVPERVAMLAAEALGFTAVVKLKIGVALALLLGIAAGGVAMLTPQAKTPTPQAERPADPPRMQETPNAERERSTRTDRYGDPLPPGAVARIGTVRWWYGQKQDIRNLCPFVYTPDGKTLILSNDNKLVRFVDAATGKELRRIAPAGGVTCFALAPDGKRLVTGPSLRLWDLASGKELRQFAKDKFGTMILAFSPDGKTIAAAGSNSTDWGIRLLDADAGKEIRWITGKNANNCSHGLVFSADGKTLFSANGIDLCRWDVRTGRLLRRLSSNFPSHDDHGFSQPAVSPDGKRFAAWEGDVALHLWDAASGETIRRIVVGRSYMARLCFSPDGRILACTIDGPQKNEILFFEADTGRELRRWDEDDSFGISHLIFSPDGKIVALVRNDVIRLRDVATGKPLLTTPGLPRGVTAVKFPREGKTLMTNCPPGRIGFWDPRTGKQLAPFRDPPKEYVHGNEDRWTRTDLTADGNKAALVDAKRVMHVWETATGKTCCHIGPPSRSWEALLSTDGKLLATGDRGNLRFWDATTGKLLRSFPAGSHFIGPVAFSPDNRILALYYISVTGLSEAPVIRLWDATTGEERSRLACPENNLPRHLLFTADGKRLIASFDPGDGWPEGVERERIGLCVWDLASGRELRRIHGSAGPIALSPDEKTLAAAEGGTILLWELASGKERGRFAGHRQRIESLAFAPDGRLVASGSLDHTACVWDVTGLCPDGRWIPRPVKQDELERLWNDLGNKDGVRAYRAVWGLAAASPSAVAFLAPRLHPISHVEGEKLPRLIADLDSNSFEVRERASAELQRLGERAESALRKALAARPSLEASRRLRVLLDRVEGRMLSTEQLHALRAVEALEQIGTSEARRLLEQLAKGAPEARLTREAQESLRRLNSGKSDKS